MDQIFNDEILFRKIIDAEVPDYAPIAYFVIADITNTLRPHAPETLLWHMCTFTKRS